ncbi:hypothetical protein AAG906_018144 [Vitis piasezkii]
MDLGPVDCFVRITKNTRYSLTWEGNDHGDVLDAHIISYLQQSGFYGDVSIILGLLIDGVVVNGSTCLDWREVCATLLGVVPEDRDIFGQRLHLTWLPEHFPSLAPDADVESLIGGFLFTDKSNNMIHLMFLPLLEDFGVIDTYSWGSVCLAWLYREMCRASRIDVHDVSGSLILLQLWIWDIFAFITPMRLYSTLHNGILPQPPLGMRYIIWEPYTDDVIFGLLDYYTIASDLWLTISPLICVHIVEWYRPDRVLRQFRLLQHILGKAI